MAHTKGSAARPHWPLLPPPLRRRRRRCCCCRCRRWQMEAPILNHGLPPPDTNTNLRPMSAGQSWDPRRPHAPAHHNPSGASKHGREQPQHAAHMPPGHASRSSNTSRAKENPPWLPPLRLSPPQRARVPRRWHSNWIRSERCRRARLALVSSIPSVLNMYE